MRELSKEQKVNLIEKNIESRLYKIYGLELELIMQTAAESNQQTIDRTLNQLELQKKAQQALEDELAKVNAL